MNSPLQIFSAVFPGIGGWVAPSTMAAVDVDCCGGITSCASAVSGDNVWLCPSDGSETWGVMLTLLLAGGPGRVVIGGVDIMGVLARRLLGGMHPK